ncbi:PREDICTED: Golgi membrane protein 1 isoform X2 [Cyprinodon variegatus]|uniref:Golgi membrane protein 1 isoform X2 n=1 Tax=Cyprinodon variegatus TaxID=28743 RepID=UPI0007427049|nr:PREDICTED: Golgi membrane protein 1 isoform X2 [Cyprinodon variegatus]
MGGLGNGRRGGRAPSLMVAALIACVLVLGFNYWVSSSHTLELQTRLNELEGQLRRGEAERGVADMKKKKEFEDQIQKQMQHINHIESIHKKELDDVHNTYTQEKVKLQDSISSSARTIEELKGQLNRLNDDLGKLQKELQSCQTNTANLSNKFTADMAHCQSQVLSQKKLCDEKLVAVKLEVQKNMQKAFLPPGDPVQETTENGAVKEEPTVKAVPSEAGTAAVVSNDTSIPQDKRDKAPELLSNEINVDKVSSEQPPTDDLPKVESQTVLSTDSKTQTKQQKKEAKTEETEATTGKRLTDNLAADKDMEVMDAHEEGAKANADPGMEDMLIGQGKADEAAIGENQEEQDEYDDDDEQVVGGADLEKERRNRNMEDEMADYNGDDDNEGEFEADKQAALAQF